MKSRKCYRCLQSFPATVEFFYRDASRPAGLSYECKSCLSDRKRGRDRRSERWANLTDEQRAKVKNRQHKYNRSIKGRACFLANAYRRIDANKGMSCDVTQEFMLESIFTAACVYCGSRENLGCDRVDNSRGHTKDNIVPACGNCNVTRGDRFSYAEMLVIGEAMAKVIKSRRGTPPTVVASEAHP